MKHVLLTALSLVLVSSCPVQADDRSSAGEATPVKLGDGIGSGYRAKAKTTTTSGFAQGSTTSQTSSTGQANSPSAQGSKITGFSSPGITTTVGGASNLPASSHIFEPGRKTAFGGKGLIPPPPTTMRLGPLVTTTVQTVRRQRGAAAADKLVTIGAGGPFTLLGHQNKEEFSSSFNWEPDNTNDSLTFKAKYTPIGGGNTHFNWIRIMLGNQVIADEYALRNKSEYTLDLTGKVERGANQIVVSGQGTAGATFEWKLTTPRKCRLTAVDPDEVVVGKDLLLKGKNFDPSAPKDVVTLGKKNLIPSAATDKQLKVRIPKDFEPGEYKVKVTIDGLSSNELKVIVRGIPELTGTNYNGIPPGAQLVIFGKNFSKKVGENKVTFDGVAADVVTASPDQITVVVPTFTNNIPGDTARISGQVGIPIRVTVGKVESINTVPINIGNSSWQDPGMKGGADAPQVPVDWRRLLEN